MKQLEGLISNEEIDARFARGNYPLNTANSRGKTKLSERKLRIPDKVTYSYQAKDGQTYSVRYMDPTSAADLNAATEVFRQGFPELHGSIFDAFVKPEELYKIANQYKILVVENSEKEIVAAAVLQPNETNMDVTWHLIAVLPKHRGKGVFSGLAEYIDKYIAETGADYASLIAATFQKENQQVFEALGFKLCGMYSGLIVAPNSDGTYNRQPVTIYEKWYKPETQFSPKSYQLTKAGKRLRRLLCQQ